MANERAREEEEKQNWMSFFLMNKFID
jgi:hypothetical protein